MHRSHKRWNRALETLKSKRKKSLSAKLNFFSVYRELSSLELVLLKWGTIILVLNYFLIKASQPQLLDRSQRAEIKLNLSQREHIILFFYRALEFVCVFPIVEKLI